MLPSQMWKFGPERNSPVKSVFFALLAAKGSVLFPGCPVLAGQMVMMTAASTDEGPTRSQAEV